MAGAASAATLDRIAQDKSIRIAYRDDAPPFSYKGKGGQPAGYMVDLCRAVAQKLAEQLKLPTLNIVYVPVTAVDRFDAIAQGKADLLCEPTTQTLSRREQVDFSIPTFVDGAGLMIRKDGPHSLAALAGKKIGVLAGTTTEQELRNSLKEAGVTADVMPANTHEEGLAMLDDGKVSAYFADRAHPGVSRAAERRATEVAAGRQLSDDRALRPGATPWRRGFSSRRRSCVEPHLPLG